MTRGGRVAVVALLLWGGAADARAQAPEDETPEQPADPYAPPQPPTGAEGLSAPAPSSAPGQGAPTATPPPSYTDASAYPGVPPAPGAPAHDAEVPPREAPEVDEDRRRGSEMIELYITSSFYAAFTTAYLLSLDGTISDEEANFIVLGALLGPATVVALDLGTGGMPTGVPPAIAMGLMGGLIQAGLLTNAFEDLVTTEEGLFGLIAGSMTVGGAAGALLGTQLRPTVSDVRLVASTALWGLYFTTLTSLAVGADGGDAAMAMLVAFNAGAIVGTLLTPLNELSSGKVLLLSAGLAAGAAAGFMVTGAASAGRIDGQALAAAMGIGSLIGLVGTYLLVRPSDSDPAPSEQRADNPSMPFVAPTADGRGAMVGWGGLL